MGLQLEPPACVERNGFAVRTVPRDADTQDQNMLSSRKGSSSNPLERFI